MAAPEVREQYRAQLIDVEVPGSYQYFEALQQDYEQMPRQQLGLRNHTLEYLHLAQEEVNVARFHMVVDRYLEGGAKS